MDSLIDREDQPSRPPPRFSLFRNRPTWANTSQPTAVDEEDRDPFNKTDQTLAQLHAEDSRKKERKEKKKQIKVKKETLSREFLTKRIKYEEVQDLVEDGDLDVPSNDTNGTIQSKTSSPGPHTPPVVVRNRRENEATLHGTPSEKFKAMSGTIIDLDSESEDNVGATEHSEALQAHEGAQIQSRENATGAAGLSEQGEDFKTNLATPPAPETELPDPVITIFITSSIPDTTPLLVQRKLSQRLKEVRLAWCKRQEFDEVTTASVFLTWRKRRLFDFTSSRGLGLNVDANGEVYIEGHEDQPPGDENAQIHMEATTKQILEAEKKAAARPPEDRVVEPASPKGKGGQPGIKVILRSRGFEDYKLVVRPHTPFKQIASVFRKMRNVEADKSVTLEFDGDMLDAEHTVGDSEISDMDMISVIIK